jgi:hypothetical protein
MSDTTLADAVFDLCSSCRTQYNRNRRSICQCKHCSQHFCVDCMNHHGDELRHDWDRLGNLSYQVQELTHCTENR